MPPTTVVDKTLREKGSGKGRENLLDLFLGFIWGQGGGGGLFCYFFSLLFSPKENVPGPLPTLILLDSRSLLR